MWLSLGGFQEKAVGDERIYNTHVIVDSSGASTSRQCNERAIRLPDVLGLGRRRPLTARGAVRRQDRDELPEDTPVRRAVRRAG